MKIISLKNQVMTPTEYLTYDKADRITEIVNNKPKLVDLFLEVCESIEDHELILIETHVKE